MAYGEFNGHVTDDVTWPRFPKGQTRDPNARRVQYLENIWTCYLETSANYMYHLPDSLLWGISVCKFSDSFASCLLQPASTGNALTTRWNWGIHKVSVSVCHTCICQRGAQLELGCQLNWNPEMTRQQISVTCAFVLWFKFYVLCVCLR